MPKISGMSCIATKLTACNLFQTSTFDNVPPFYEIDWKDTKDLDQKALDLVKWVITPKKFKLTKVLTKKVRNDVGNDYHNLQSEISSILELHFCTYQY